MNDECDGNDIMQWLNNDANHYGFQIIVDKNIGQDILTYEN